MFCASSRRSRKSVLGFCPGKNNLMLALDEDEDSEGDDDGENDDCK